MPLRVQVKAEDSYCVMNAEFAEQTWAERLFIMKSNTVFRPGPVERCEGAASLGP